MGLLFLFGLIVGSFYNVVIYRLPQGESLIYPGSSCPNCGEHLSSKELIPVLSYILQRGKCKHCKDSISWQYPLVELLTGLGFVVIGTQSSSLVNLLAGLVFFSLLLILAFIDAKHMLLPNVLTVSGLVSGLLFALFGWTVPFGHSFFGFITGGGILLAISVISKGGMGMGDVKLLAMIGSFLGPRNAMFTLFWASFMGSIWGLSFLYITKKDRKTPIPFGPFLAAAAVLMYFVGQG